MSLQIIIPFFGSFDLLKNAVMSVLDQDNQNWNLIIIDDYSQEIELPNFVSDLNDPRVTLVSNRFNMGIARNFQSAIDIASEEYTVIMGCDDKLLPRYVDKCFSLIDSFPSSSFFQPGVEIIDEDGLPFLGLTDFIKKFLGKQGKYPIELKGEELASSLSHGCWTYFPSLCWKTSVLQKYGLREDYSIVLDMDLEMRIIADQGSMVVDNEPVFQYRRHRASASMTAAVDGKRFDEERRLYTELEQYFVDKGWKKARRAAKWRLTSRLNSGLHLALCLVTFKFAFVPKLWRHTFS